MYVCDERGGGAGSDGVGGGGADGASRVEARFRGTSFGSLLLRSGGGTGTSGCVIVSCSVRVGGGACRKECCAWSSTSSGSSGGERPATPSSFHSEQDA
jgi:hypothetical protein